MGAKHARVTLGSGYYRWKIDPWRRYQRKIIRRYFYTIGAIIGASGLLIAGVAIH